MYSQRLPQIRHGSDVAGVIERFTNVHSARLDLKLYKHNVFCRSGLIENKTWDLLKYVLEMWFFFLSLLQCVFLSRFAYN